ncbi:formimidoylglutamate deiminase [Nguyenibacter vanlangensis]|uniref:Formimidoylglutamate deiminase n=1 Tax=Nguyenibacter vanlangensis TaxID=1216886 RepID=A0ABZ3D0Q5_9PROT
MSPSPRNGSLFAGLALLPEGWRRDVRIGFAEGGAFGTVVAGCRPEAGDRRADIVLPPLPGLHSHAFQRAMAGLAECRTDPADSFWTWRERMYALAGTLQPDTLRAVAAFVYMEMLEAGYTQVAEFHYLHRAPDGAAYARPGAMAEAVVDGALTAGIGITMLPTLYMRAGFGQDLAPSQRRFRGDPDFIARIIADLGDRFAGASLLRRGVGLHSLRAVDGDCIRAMLRAAPEDGPVHIHVAEQRREVEDCLAALGARPVRWLMDHCPVDARWCLVHATHMDAGECGDLARSGAVAGLCPITEANLGDGIFPLAAFIDEGGRFGVGPDSNILLSPGEELRLLEYGQRLRSQQRCRALPAGRTGSVGRFLYDACLAGGAQACGMEAGIAPGRRADLCTLAAEDLALPGLTGDAILDSVLFARPALPVSDVLCAGRWVVAGGRHVARDAIARDFRAAMARLSA